MKKNREISYRKILLNIVFLLAMVVSFLYLILYQYFEQQTLANTVEKAVSELSYINQNMEYMNDTVIDMGCGLFIEEELRPLLYEKVSNREVNNGIHRLKKIRLVSQYIHSVYLYNRNTHMIYCSSGTDTTGVFREEDFSDQDIFPIIEEGLYRNSVFVPRKIQGIALKSGTKAVYSYFLSNDFEDYVIVLNVLISNTTDLFQTPDCETLIVDTNGCLLNYCQLAPVLSDVSDVEFVSSVLENENTSGYFFEGTDKKQLVVYLNMPALDRSYIKVFDYDKINGSVVDLRNYSIIITIAVLLIGIVLAGVWARKLYLPITKMEEMLNKAQDENRQNKYKNKQAVLRLLFDDVTIHQRNLWDKLEKYHISCDKAGSFVLILMKIDSYDLFCKKNSLSERELWRYAISNIAHEIAGYKYGNETIEMPGNCILLLLDLNKACADKAGSRKDIYSLCQEIQAKVEEYMEISLSCVVSNEGDFEQLPLLYQDVKEAEQYQLYFGKRCVISVADVDAKKEQDYLYSEESEKKLINALNMGNLDEANQRYAEIVNTLYFQPVNVLYANLLRLFIAVSDAASQRECQTAAGDVYNDMATELVLCEDIVEINQMFRDCFEKIIEKHQNWQNSKHNQMVEKVNRMISAESSNKNLSLNLIADSLAMSPDYVGKLFKKYTGKSIVTRINEERIENAKRMLLDTRLPINDISDKVGFTTDKYFFALFKKMNGITPSEYRKKHLIQETEE